MAIRLRHKLLSRLARNEGPLGGRCRTELPFDSSVPRVEALKRPPRAVAYRQVARRYRQRKRTGGRRRVRGEGGATRRELLVSGGRREERRRSGNTEAVVRGFERMLPEQRGSVCVGRVDEIRRRVSRI